MQRKTLLATTLGLLFAGSATFALAQSATPAPSAPAPKASPASKVPPRADLDDDMGFFDGPMGRMGPGSRGGPGFGRPGFGGPGFGGPRSPVISDLKELEHLYITSGRAKELPALYNEVLSKTQDPQVRTYVYHHLAHAQAAPANTDQAIATLRKSLDENLANEAKRRADMDKMRKEWEQRRAPAGKPAPAPQP
ncbi:hypothetical protein DVT68_05205 [Dyella solisilvae]|uniref:Uncharacterized protein n=1 Tax=Dyella solisilvae TaxID=1920168 RepID=A0A370KCP7_9GAMM|nr:hypothetical protein [Dyella solisilvae]RDJ00208.1 hypothetical protein DVT68_05205 [Dyella solisilvae]